MERPSFLSGGYDLLWWQDEPVEAGVSQLDAGNSNHQPFIGFENTLTELMSFELLILARNKDIGVKKMCHKTLWFVHTPRYQTQ